VSTGQSQPQLDAPIQTFPQSHSQSQPMVSPVSTGLDYAEGNTNNRMGNGRKVEKPAGCLMM